MRHGILMLPADRARYFVDQIGAKSRMQFEDMNAQGMQRPYKTYIQRIDEMERIIRFLFDELERVPDAEVTTGKLDDFLLHSGDYRLDDVEGHLKKFYKDFVQMKEHNTKLLEKRNAALEERFVLQTAVTSMSLTPRGMALRGSEQFEFSASRSLLGEESVARRGASNSPMFGTVAGVISQESQDLFARALFRTTRGNTFTHFEPIQGAMEDPKTRKPVFKSVFVVYFQDARIGQMTSAMSEKIRKVCSSFGVNTYAWPASKESSEQMRRTLEAQVEDMNAMVQAHEHMVYSEAAYLLEQPRRYSNSLIEEWRQFCVKEKSIYATLNQFDNSSMHLRADCWFPEEEEDSIRKDIVALNTQCQSTAMLVADRVPTKKTPPTYIKTTDFTRPFQDLVDTYGLPRYREANPTLLTIVTFPFLFGVMFGDIGHGLGLMAVGLASILYADRIKDIPHLETFYFARYMLFMMGFFATYAGFMYNDFLSLGLNIFGSHYATGHETGGARTEVFDPSFDAANSGGSGPYPFGVDPVWHGATNELVFMNSMKMKTSIVLGVTHMFVGLVMRCINKVHERNAIDFFCECIPMVIFLLSFFGFMVFQILYKWVTPLENPPSIINSMIAMAMFGTDPSPMFGSTLPFNLMVITMLTVPIMLIPKPLLLYLRHSARSTTHERLPDEESIELESEHDSFEIGEVVIHQVIETIEYVLGTVSHTASYLRLWALSLAHQQLALVFFQKTLSAAMLLSFPVNSFALYFVAFPLWLGITIGILMGMDIMECFLHTLRLHWVEYQTKFYHGDGHAFRPFRHRSIQDTWAAGAA